MVPMQDPAVRRQGVARVNDISDVDDDDWAVYSDTESISSRSTASDTTFASVQETLPALLSVGKEDLDKPVYEAYNMIFVPDTHIATGGAEVLGVGKKEYRTVGGKVTVTPIPSTQSELASMHLHAVEAFQAKHKRCWPVRAMRGNTKTYEQDLEEKCSKLPAKVRMAMAGLLSDRGRTSSSRYRTRVWTIVSMREQRNQRFAQADFPEVKRHKIRFWKNPGPEEPLLYTLILRGAETKSCADVDGFNTFGWSSNPWRFADNAEARSRGIERRRQQEARRQKGSESPASHRARAQSVSPPSYRSGRRRDESSAPSACDSRYDSPPPYPMYPSRRVFAPMRSGSPIDRIRVVRRHASFSDAAPVPTPPESYTPPPEVLAYNRPSVVPPSTTYDNPFLPRQPLATNVARCPVAPMLQPQFTPEFTPATCAGHQTARPCPHFPPNPPSYRPTDWRGVPHQQPCGICALRPAPVFDPPYFGQSCEQPLSSPVPPPAPFIPPLSTPSLSTFPSGTPPPPPPQMSRWSWSSASVSAPAWSTAECPEPELHLCSNPSSSADNMPNSDMPNPPQPHRVNDYFDLSLLSSDSTRDSRGDDGDASKETR